MTDSDLGSVIEDLDVLVQHTPDERSAAPDSGTALVVSCSMAQWQHGRSLWPVDPSWNIQSLTTLGSQIWDCHDDELVVDDTLTHGLAERDIRAILVVGHTDCEVVANAYERCFAQTEQLPVGISTRLNPLVSLVDDAVDAGIIDSTTPPRTARYRLVEYNVIQQVAFLIKRLSSSITVVGYVHDQDGVYDSFPGKQYLVAVDGETDPAELAARLPDSESTPVGHLRS